MIQNVQRWPLSHERGGEMQVDRLLRDLQRVLENSPAVSYRGPGAGVYPLMNVSQDEDNFYVRSEIPGVKAEDLEVSVTGRSVTVAGERKIEAEAPNVRYHRRERPSGKFRRQFNLPTDLDTDKVQAQYRHGILMLVLPKAEHAKPRKVTISG